MASDDTTDRREQESDEKERADSQQQPRRERSGRTATDEPPRRGGPQGRHPPGQQPEAGSRGQESPATRPESTRDQQPPYQGQQPRKRPLDREFGDEPVPRGSPPKEPDQRRMEEMQRMGAEPQMGAQSGPAPQAGGSQPPTAAPPTAAGGETESRPSVSSAVDIIERNEELIVLVDTPGFKKENIEIEADEHSLILTAERDSEVDEDETFVQHERPTTIQRVVPLPAEVDIDEAEATYEDGVSSITLPKHDEEEGRHTIGFQ